MILEDQKPYAPSCDKNREPILGVLQSLLGNTKSLLEIGAGTGQHAVFMAPHFDRMDWTLADRRQNHKGISLWLEDFPSSNIHGPIEYEIPKSSLSKQAFDGVFTSNTVHMIPWNHCLKMFDDVNHTLLPEGLFVIYGAFNYKDQFTSESNKNFDTWLKQNDPQSGIKNFEDVTNALETLGFKHLQDISMPANNRILVFRKTGL